MLELVLLRTFVAVFDEGGFGRAAARLNLTQSAVSGHLRRLEEQVGKPLLKRTTRSFEMTQDGERLLAYARAMLALNREIWPIWRRHPFTAEFASASRRDSAQASSFAPCRHSALIAADCRSRCKSGFRVRCSRR